jgi:hypothetical protein
MIATPAKSSADKKTCTEAEMNNFFLSARVKTLKLRMMIDPRNLLILRLINFLIFAFPSELDSRIHYCSRSKDFQWGGIKSIGESCPENHGSGATTFVESRLERLAAHQLYVELEIM